MIVADSGPIMAFARMGRLNLLRQVAGELVVPDAVYEELVGKGANKPGATEVAQGVWIKRMPVQDRAAVDALPRVLHPGEREAIILAQELQAHLLIDEQRGRQSAIARGLAVVGSLRILAEAKRLGFIDRVRPLVDAMFSVGYWIDEELLPPFFREVGEENHSQ
jgi:hypothetical protein